MESTLGRNRWLTLLFVCISLLVISLDNTILNVALPQIATALEASASELQWIVDAYVLVFAALLLTMGAIGDRIGRKRVLQFGLAWFGTFSVIAGLSTSTEMLTASRALMGVGGAVIMPATLSIVTATFRDPKERGRAIAIWAAVFGLGVGIGPVTGGWLLERFDWGAVFFVNVPVVITALIGGAIYITDSKDPHAPRPDWVGVVLSIFGLFALIYGIIEAGIDGWTADHVVAAFAAAAVLLGLFAWWESRVKEPMLPLRFFRNMSFTGANTALALITFSMFGTMFFMSQYFQTVQGYGPLDTGLRLLPIAFFIIPASALSARVAERFGVKLTVAAGTLVAASGMLFVAQAIDIDTPYETILIGMALISSGMGLTMPPATDSIMGSVPVSKAGIGSAMNDTTRQLGGAMGIAVLGTVANGIYLDKVRELQQTPLIQNAMSTLPQDRVAMMTDAIEGSIQGAHVAAERMVADAPALMQNVVQQVADVVVSGSSDAFVNGMSEAMVIGAGIMFISAVGALILLPSRIRPYQGDDADDVAETAPQSANDTGEMRGLSTATGD